MLMVHTACYHAIMAVLTSSPLPCSRAKLQDISTDPKLRDSSDKIHVRGIQMVWKQQQPHKVSESGCAVVCAFVSSISIRYHRQLLGLHTCSIFYVSLLVPAHVIFPFGMPDEAPFPVHAVMLCEHLLGMHIMCSPSQQ